MNAGRQDGWRGLPYRVYARRPLRSPVTAADSHHREITALWPCWRNCGSCVLVCDTYHVSVKGESDSNDASTRAPDENTQSTVARLESGRSHQHAGPLHKSDGTPAQDQFSAGEGEEVTKTFSIGTRRLDVTFEFLRWSLLACDEGLKRMDLTLPNYGTKFDWLSLSACYLELQGLGEPRHATGFFLALE